MKKILIVGSVGSTCVGQVIAELAAQGVEAEIVTPDEVPKEVAPKSIMQVKAFPIEALPVVNIDVKTGREMRKERRVKERKAQRK